MQVGNARVEVEVEMRVRRRRRRGEGGGVKRKDEEFLFLGGRGRIRYIHTYIHTIRREYGWRLPTEVFEPVDKRMIS